MNQELEQQRVLILNLRAQNSFLKLELLKVTGGDIPDDLHPIKPDHDVVMVPRVADQDYKQMRLDRLSLADDEPIERDLGREMELCGEKGDVAENERMRRELGERKGCTPDIKF